VYLDTNFQAAMDAARFDKDNSGRRIHLEDGYLREVMEKPAA
jgi:hypothetical protein